MATQDNNRTARDIVDANQYVVLGTADADGRPWASPVYFAHLGYREFIWVSYPDTRHSTNIALRPAVGMVIFDSAALIGTGVGVYVEAEAAEVVGDPGRYLDAYSARSLEHGGSAWTIEDVTGTARLRLYRAVAANRSLLVRNAEGEARVPVDLP